MKKILIGILMVVMVALVPVSIFAASNFYGAIGLTGGTTGALDAIDGTSLADGDAAYVVTPGGAASQYYVYVLDDDSAAAESSPDVIAPDSNAGDKRWILIFHGDAATAEMADLAVTDSNFIVGNGTTWVAESGATARTSIGLGTADDVDFNTVDSVGQVDAGTLTVNSGSITDSSGAISFGDENLTTTGTLGAGAATVTSLNNSDGNITNVGDIALDSISSDAGTSINVDLGSDAGDDFTVDTTKLVVEGDTGRVGIGTAAPEASLDINHATGDNLQLTYNDSDGSAANHVDFAVSSSGDLTITPSGGDVSVTGVLTDSHYETIYIPAASMSPTSTNGAVLGSYEYPTNDIQADYLAFDGATEQYATFMMPFPAGWDRSTVKVKFYWSSATGSTTADTVEWEIAGRAVSDDDAIDAALGTAQVISDTLLADNGADMQVTAATPALTVGGTPALGDMLVWKVSRNVGGTDDMTENAWLMGALIQLKVTNAEASW